MTINLSNWNGCSHSEYQFDGRKQDWQVQKFEVRWLHKAIVIRGDWLWKAANINDKNNSAAVYVGSTVKVHNPLFSVGKLLRNKLTQRFYRSIQSKWKEFFWTLCTFRSTKTYNKGVWRVSWPFHSINYDKAWRQFSSPPRLILFVQQSS